MTISILSKLVINNNSQETTKIIIAKIMKIKINVVYDDVSNMVFIDF